MSTLFIVHGAFGGGWEWTEVADLLRALGHRVFTPTLSGFGERHHLGPRTTLSTNVQDVISVLEFEDLRDVTLCGASYGGMAATGAADSAPQRIRMVVYVDALVPTDGQRGVDLLPPGFTEAVRAAAGPDGHGWVDMPPSLIAAIGDVPEAKREHFASRYRSQPVATFTDPIHLSGAVDRLRRAFVRCTAGGLEDVGDPIPPHAERARREGWIYRELDAPHDPHVFDPHATARLLDELAAL